MPPIDDAEGAGHAYSVALRRVNRCDDRAVVLHLEDDSTTIDRVRDLGERFVVVLARSHAEAHEAFEVMRDRFTYILIDLEVPSRVDSMFRAGVPAGLDFAAEAVRAGYDSARVGVLSEFLVDEYQQRLSALGVPEEQMFRKRNRPVGMILDQMDREFAARETAEPA